MVFTTILSTQTDAESPLDQALTDTIRLDLDDLNARTVALEAGGSGGSSSSVTDLRYGSIIAGFQTNEPILWRKRYSPLENVLRSGEKNDSPVGFDPGAEDQSRWLNTSDNSRFTVTVSADSYRGLVWEVPKSKRFEFKVKKGENFFGIMFLGSTIGCNAAEVYIDGLSITAFTGITDENGAAGANNFSTTTGTTQRCRTVWFFGLDGKEHNIRVINNDSGVQILSIEAVEIGYRTPEGAYTVDNVVHTSAGRVSVRGTEVATAETDLTLGTTLGNGFTSAIVATKAGVLSVLDGIEPAFTMAKPETAITFSAAVTSLIAQSTRKFPSSGFLLVTTPFGQHSIASYTSKTQTDVANDTFAGMLWQSQPSTDFTPANNINSATLGAATGDVGINLWAGGGHVVSASNNKLDFKVTKNGTQATFAATIANGLYSADLLPLGFAIKKAMQTANPLTNGEYFIVYNEAAHRWTIGITGDNNTELQLLFSSGGSVANSIHTTLGYSTTDLTTKRSYVAQTEVESMAHRVFRKGDFVSAFDSRFKSTAAQSFAAFPAATHLDLVGRLGLPAPKVMQTETAMMEFYCDEDCAGLAIHVQPMQTSTTLFISVDEISDYRALHLDQIVNTSTRSKVLTAFISFPRGSHRINIFQSNNTEWENDAAVHQFSVVGVTQYFTKPKIEALTTSQAVIRSFDVAPLPLFQTWYADNYTPGANDNVDTITFTGSWTAVVSGAYWNGRSRQTTTLNDFVDFTFTTVGDGGGFGWMSGFMGAESRKTGLYLKAGATVTEPGNKIHNSALGHSAFNIFQWNGHAILGLPAGQYTCRIKNEEAAGTINLTGFVVYDTVQPETKNTVSAVTNTGQTVSWPKTGVARNIYYDEQDRTPTWLSKLGYKEGIAYLDSSISASVPVNLDEDATIMTSSRNWYSRRALAQAADFFRMFNFCKSVYGMEETRTTYSTAMQPSLDGTNFASYSSRINTKGGSTYGVNSTVTTQWQKNFLQPASGTMSNSTTFLLIDTKGLKIGQTLKVFATGETTLKRVIATITADTSITFTQAITNFANYTVANAARITFNGFHSWKIVNADAPTNTGFFHAMAYVPMDVLPSNDDARRLSADKIGEVAEIVFTGVVDNADLYYPVFSDGRQADWIESTISLIQMTNATATWNIPLDLRDVRVSAGTMDIKIVSVRRY